MAQSKILLHESWLNQLASQFNQPYFIALRKFLVEEKRKGKTIYPPGNLIFNAFNLCPFNEVKVVIIGQDPYHNVGQAHGLCFSVLEGVKVPPSLNNIYKELHTDVGIEIPDHGNLSNWAKQGVLMLNAMLTVEAHQPASHQKIGWQNLTDAAIKAVSEKHSNVVFLLWGSYAKKKSELIDESKHHVLKSPHPSPFSAHTGFFGNKHFSKTNTLLIKANKQPINWQV